MKRTVVIVDDHEGFRTRARELLESDGYDVIGESADTRSALSAVRSLRPDVVILDIQLPDGSGLDIARELLAHAGSVVLISSRERSAYGGRVAESGAQGFVWKADLSGAAIAAVITDGR